MYREKRQEVWASDIAAYLNAKLVGADSLVESAHAIRVPGLSLRKEGAQGTRSGGLLIVGREAGVEPSTTCIISENPERDLALVLLEFFSSPIGFGVDSTARVSPSAVLGRNVRIGCNSVIEDDVQIGDWTWIMNNVVVHSSACLGKECVIKDGAIIGSEGYGFVQAEDGRLIHPPQLGRVVLGDRVWVGANTTVERAMLEETTIEDEVKIDDLVHLGQGSVVGKASLITAGCVISHHVRIGATVCVGPNTSVREHVRIASGVTVGQGAVVVSDLQTAGVYVGVPARLLHNSKGKVL